MFSGYSRWTAAGVKRQPLPQARKVTDSLPPRRLLLFGRKQSSSLFSPPDPHTNPLPGGCCSRNQVQAFDPAPDHRLKGCHFNFRPFSIPRYSSSFQSLGDTLFLKSPSRSFPSFQTPSVLCAQNLQSSRTLRGMNAGELCAAQNNNCLCFCDPHSIRAQ